MSAIVKSMPSTALAVSGSVRLDGINDVFALAKGLAAAEGFIPKNLLGKPNAIAAAILTGIELGLGPMEAIRSIHIVEGKPTMSADLMLARALRAGIRIEWEQQDATAAILRLERGGMKHRHSFTIEEARTAELAGKGNWKKYPAAMLRARCVSAAMRAFCPDVLGSGVYTPEELEAVPETTPKGASLEIVHSTPKRTLDDIAEPAPQAMTETEAGEVVPLVEALISRFGVASTKEEHIETTDVAKREWSRLSKEEQSAVTAARKQSAERIKQAMEGAQQ